jgi:hypothetical protein
MRCAQQEEVRDKEATFALLDQRTFECHWDTVRALATHKEGWPQGRAVLLPAEQVAAAALPRRPDEESGDRDALVGSRRLENVRVANDAPVRRSLHGEVQDQVRLCLGEGMAHQRANIRRGSVTYFMICAPDHPEAPFLMRRAFERAVEAPKPVVQMAFAQFGMEIR